MLFGPFSQKDPQKYKKSIRFLTKSEWRFGEIVKSQVEKAYKTCRLWRLLEAIFQKAPKKYQKSIRFIG